LIRGPINSGLVRRVLYLHLHRLRVFDFRLGLFGRQWILDSYYAVMGYVLVLRNSILSYCCDTLTSGWLGGGFFPVSLA